MEVHITMQMTWLNTHYSHTSLFQRLHWGHWWGSVHYDRVHLLNNHQRMPPLRLLSTLSKLILLMARSLSRPTSPALSKAIRQEHRLWSLLSPFLLVKGSLLLVVVQEPSMPSKAWERWTFHGVAFAYQLPTLNAAAWVFRWYHCPFQRDACPYW